MKTKVFVITCLIALGMGMTGGVLWAQVAPGDTPPPPPPPGDNTLMPPPPGGPDGPPEAMGPDPARMDADGNSRVTAPEFSNGPGPVMQDRFKQMDTNGDGNLSLEEFEKGPRPGRGPRGMAMGPGDFAGPPPPPAGEAQGQCPPAGMPTGQRLPKRPPFPMSGACDANNDGIISEAEFLTAHQQAALERFKELDTDQDGQVTLEQLRSARGPMGGPRGPKGGPGGPRGGFGPDSPDGGRGPHGGFGQGGPRP